MRLDKFVEESLLQIVRGIEAAQSQTDFGVINPSLKVVIKEKIKNIDFDIAVTVEDIVEAGTEAKISVLGSKLGGAVEGKNSSEVVSRIKFSVPITYPEKEKVSNDE